MRIFSFFRFFFPDTSPYGVVLRLIGAELANAGHSVRVFTSKPSYGKDAPKAPRWERLDGIQVRRIWLLPEHRRNPLVRLINLVIYCTALVFYVVFSRADVVSAATFPPVLGAWTASVAARLTNARFIYHVQDIHSELSFYTGGRLGRGLTFRLLRWLDDQTLRRANKIVTLSPDMAETLRARRGRVDLPIRIVNNPPLTADKGLLKPATEYPKPKGTYRVIFAGNLGRFQNLSLLAQGVALCFATHPELELMFLGDGLALAELKQRWGDHPQVCFVPYLPFAQAKEIISNSDVGLVSLRPNIYRVAYPSKIATYLDLGLKILALVESDSHLAREIIDRGHGEVCEEATPKGISSALENLMKRSA